MARVPGGGAELLQHQLLAALGCWGSVLHPLLGLLGAGAADFGFVPFPFLLLVRSSELSQ